MSYNTTTILILCIFWRQRTGQNVIQCVYIHVDCTDSHLTHQFCFISSRGRIILVNHNDSRSYDIAS